MSDRTARTKTRGTRSREKTETVQGAPRTWAAMASRRKRRYEFSTGAMMTGVKIGTPIGIALALLAFWYLPIPFMIHPSRPGASIKGFFAAVGIIGTFVGGGIGGGIGVMVDLMKDTAGGRKRNKE